MKPSYVLNRSTLPIGSKSKIDLVVSFASTEAASSRRGLNLSLVIDRSGSMAGTSLKQAVKAAQGVVERMASGDRLSVVIYDDDVDTLVAPQIIGDKDKAAIRTQLGKVRAGGCTNLHGGWLQGVKHVEKHQSPQQLNRVLLLTDGQANVGTTEPKKIIEAAKGKAAAGVATTALGFGSNFNEDLLLGMAAAGEGNFYFIESPEDAEGVFNIEIDGLASVVAQNLKVRLEPATGVTVGEVLNRYQSAVQPSGSADGALQLGDVYAKEEKLLAIELEVTTGKKAGKLALGTLHYSYQVVVGGDLKVVTGELPLELAVSKDKTEAAPDQAVEVKTARLRIAKGKDDAVTLADAEKLGDAAKRLRQIIDQIKLNPIVERFEIAEELDQLEHYAQKLEQRSFDNVVRKEMMDQAYQARTRNRSELNLRGTAGGSTSGLEAVTDAGSSVVLRCEKESGKLRIRVTSDGYDKSLHVQFPRAIREEGASYAVDAVVLSADKSYYRAQGKIRRLLLPGESRAASGSPSRRKTGKAATVSCTAADLPTVTSVGDGILVQCVKEGAKLRARVVSDGYDPNFNMRFPRSVREVGVLYVVDEVILGPGGNSYIACGDVKRLIQ